MGRAPCCEKDSVKRGPWTPEEDAKLLACISQYGTGSWRTLPKKAGLQRCGKSCRLRWTNYLRPDLKHGRFSEQEEQLIVKLHAALGSRWSLIAAQLPGRTDNDVKNYWNTRLKKKLCEMGIDPITHKPISQLLADLAGSMANNTSKLETTSTTTSYGGDLTEATLGCFKDDMLNVLMRKRSMGQPMATINNNDNNPKNNNYMNNSTITTNSTLNYGVNPSESAAVDPLPDLENSNPREDFPIRKPSLFSSGAYFSGPSGPVSGIRSASARMRTQSIFSFDPTIPAKTSAIFSSALQDCSTINPVPAAGAIDPASAASSPRQKYQFSPTICNNDSSTENYQNDYHRNYESNYQTNYRSSQFLGDQYSFMDMQTTPAPCSNGSSYLNYYSSISNPGLNYDYQSLITHQISQLGRNSSTINNNNNYNHENIDDNTNDDNNDTVPDLNLASAANPSIFYTALLKQQEETLCNSNLNISAATELMETSPFSAPSTNHYSSTQPSKVKPSLFNYGLINSSRYCVNYDSATANNYNKTEHNIWSPATNSGSSSSSNLLTLHHLSNNNNNHDNHNNHNLIPSAGHHHINHNLIANNNHNIFNNVHQLDGVLNVGSTAGTDSTSGLLWDFSELGSMVS